MRYNTVFVQKKKMTRDEDENMSKLEKTYILNRCMMHRASQLAQMVKETGV